ncbi:DUF3558 domain-containing protein [Streptomyces sp. NBC_01268]|uniref:DUF3558 domain-containing protein n=1 Tax=Streptomyces sp. NBC_01268 TaxID=2903806 RepID=UPI002E3175A1|nr:DUF3558 domain-containing protein [Streptomyces sp. NBC_01268]
MQRKAYAPGRSRPAVLTAAALALGLGIGLSGCSSGAKADIDTVDSKAGPASPTAPPGRYRTLFEPCGAVPQATLKDLLPGAAALPDAERDRAYRGTAAVTFDTDRRVGCSWKADSPDAAHRLTLDIERVVSYDPAVSDDDRAQEVYVGKQTAAGVPITPKSATPTPTATASATGTAAAGHLPPQTPGGHVAGSGNPPAGQSGSAGAPGATAPSSSPTTGLEPRSLEGLGEVAYLDDALTTTGPAGVKRLVSVVFRTSNVIVTVQYEEQSTASTEAPDSGELQEKARNLARLLVERLEE